MKVGEAELLVGAVCIVIVQAPTQQQRIAAQLRFESVDDRNRTAFANKHRCGAESSFDGFRRGGHERVV